MMSLKENVYVFNGEIMFHSAFKKDAEKAVLLEVKGLTQIIVLFKAFLISKHPFEGYEISVTKTCHAATQFGS